MKESLSTKELIRDTLQKLLEEKDYAEISMKEIAKSANVGRRTLYRYFGTKDDIVRFMADSVMDEFADCTAFAGSEGLKGDDKHLFFVLGEKCGGISLSGSESSFDYIEDHLSEYIMQVAFKTKMKDVDMEPEQVLSEMSKERLYNFYFTIAGYWELTKRWMREENRSTPAEISSLVIKILTERED